MWREKSLALSLCSKDQGLRGLKSSGCELVEGLQKKRIKTLASGCACDAIGDAGPDATYVFPISRFGTSS